MPKVKLCPKCKKRMRRLYLRPSYSFSYIDPNTNEKKYVTKSNLLLWGFTCTCGHVESTLYEHIYVYDYKLQDAEKEITQLKERIQSLEDTFMR